ncbi:hypothetical protein Tco_1243970 [Tanacetum coccineum]
MKFYSTRLTRPLFYGNSTIQDSELFIRYENHLKWKHLENKESGIELSEKSIGESKMAYGEFQGRRVAVEKLQRKGDL